MNKFESLCSLRSNKPYLDVNKQIKLNHEDFDINIRFYHYRGEQEESPNMYGFDSIIVLDFHWSTAIFTKLIEEFKINRKKIMNEIIGKCSPLTTNITIILIASSEMFKQKIIEENLKEEQGNRWHIA